MKKSFTLLALSLCLSSVISAAPIRSQKAQQLAGTFFGTTAKGSRNIRISYQAKANTGGEENLYYIINRGEKEGFVVISGDTRTRTILAYSDKGYLNEEIVEKHPSIHWMFNQYAQEIEWAKKNLKDVPSKSYKALTAGASAEPKHLIEPLMEVFKSDRTKKRPQPISWGQAWPFNSYCPNVTDRYGYVYPTVSGCVATAISSVLRWHEYPSKSKGSNSYIWKATGQRLSINFDQQPGYDWTQMPTAVDANGNDRATGQRLTTTQADNIGRLLRDVGYGVNMNYGPSAAGGSGAFLTDAPSMLVEHFGYDGRLECIFRSNYQNIADWMKEVQDELNNYGPIVYAGISEAGGHCFVIDGLAEQNYVHVEWGWNQMSNCWSLISVLEPDTHGIGGGVGAFSRGQQMLRFLQPSTGDYEPITIADEVSKKNYDKAAYQDVAINIKNQRTKSFYGKIRLYINKVGETNRQLLDATPYNILISGRKDRLYNFTVDFSNFAAGNYELHLSYSEDNTKWTDIQTSAGTITIGGGAPNPDPKPDPKPVTDNKFSISKTAEQTVYKQEDNQRVKIGISNKSDASYYEMLKLYGKKEGSTEYKELATTSWKSYIGSNSSSSIYFPVNFANMEVGNYELRVGYLENGEWKTIEETAGNISITGKRLGAKLIVTSLIEDKQTKEGEAVTIRIPVSNKGDEDFTGNVSLMANGTIISGGNVTLPAGKDATLAFTTNTPAFMELKAGTYNLTLASNGNEIDFNGTKVLGKLTIMADNKPEPTPEEAVGDISLNSAYFYQNGRYVGSSYCTLSKNADVTIKANLYTSNGFKGNVKFFLSDKYGGTTASTPALQTLQTVELGKYNNGYVEFTIKKEDLTATHYQLNLSYYNGQNEVCNKYDGVSFYVSSYRFDANNNSNRPNEHGDTYYINELETGKMYIPVGFSDLNAGITDGIGTIETAEKSLNIFPTVATDNVTIVTPKATTAIVFTLQGAAKESIHLNVGANNINVSNFGKGVYLVKVNNQTLKFIKK